MESDCKVTSSQSTEDGECQLDIALTICLGFVSPVVASFLPSTEKFPRFVDLLQVFPQLIMAKLEELKCP